MRFLLIALAIEDTLILLVSNPLVCEKRARWLVGQRESKVDEFLHQKSARPILCGRSQDAKIVLKSLSSQVSSLIMAEIQVIKSNDIDASKCSDAPKIPTKRSGISLEIPDLLWQCYVENTSDMLQVQTQLPLFQS